MKYNAVTEELLQELRQVVGEKYVKTDPSVLDIYKADESLAPSYWVMPEAVVLPADAREFLRQNAAAKMYNRSLMIA